MKLCPKCKNVHIKPGIFCSRSCANSRSWSESDKITKSEAATKSDKLKVLNSKRGKRNRKYGLGPTKPKPRGGVRERAGRSKNGRFNGIYCNSTYELVWVIYHLDHGIAFSRCSETFVYDNGRKYHPDFVVGDLIVEIKGYHTPDVDAKTNAVKAANKQIVVLYRSDLQKCFEWVKTNYQYKKLEDLFE